MSNDFNQIKSDQTPCSEVGSPTNKQLLNDSESDVLFEDVPISNGLLLGLITLNRPKALNALSTEMCQLISQQLCDWENNESVVAIILRGAGERALCAGGDIRMLYSARQNWDGEGIAPPEAQAFFESEYHLDTQMHEYTKPIIAWGSGIVMGGGMGLLSSSSHRIVTETTIAAMPEVNIGLFPDATGSWFLQRYPGKTGLFMGLTGARANANDAILCNLADFKANSAHFDLLLETLCQANWQQVLTNKHSDENSLSRDIHNFTTGLLNKFSVNSQQDIDFEPSHITQFWQPIERLMTCGGLAEIDAILNCDDILKDFDADFAQSSWVQSALENYRYGCPVTKAIMFEMYHRAHNLSLTQVMALETNVALHCIIYPDFSEGVRALIIDKDKQPNWSRTLEECLTVEGQAYIDGHFERLQ